MTFSVSGMLWRNSLVMVDSPTRSMWSHLAGSAEAGELKGAKLDVIPSVICDWETWYSGHPKTTVLDMQRSAEEYRSSAKFKPSSFVIGIRNQSESKSWSFAELEEKVVINDEFQGEPVVVVYLPNRLTAYIYDRSIRGQTLTFEWKDEAMIDRETGAIWNPTTGKSNNLIWGNTALKLRRGIMSFKSAWNVFNQ